VVALFADNSPLAGGRFRACLRAGAATAFGEHRAHSMNCVTFLENSGAIGLVLESSELFGDSI